MILKPHSCQFARSLWQCSFFHLATYLFLGRQKRRSKYKQESQQLTFIFRWIYIGFLMLLRSFFILLLHACVLIDIARVLFMWTWVLRAQLAYLYMRVSRVCRRAWLYGQVSGSHRHRRDSIDRLMIVCVQRCMRRGTIAAQGLREARRNQSIASLKVCLLHFWRLSNWPLAKIVTGQGNHLFFS